MGVRAISIKGEVSKTANYRQHLDWLSPKLMRPTQTGKFKKTLHTEKVKERQGPLSS